MEFKVITKEQHEKLHKSAETATETFKKATAQMRMTLGGFNRIDKVFVVKKERLINVKWIDGSHTIVKCSKEDHFDVYVGVALAYCYKFNENKTQFRKLVDSKVIEVNDENNK